MTACCEPSISASTFTDICGRHPIRSEADRSSMTLGVLE
jgi:hypothetical protein